MRLLFTFALASSLIASPADDQKLLQQYCTGCHNAKSRVGGLALDELSTDKIGDHTIPWEKVVRRLRGRSMPPAGLPRPTEKNYQSLVSNLETELDRLAAAKPNPGRTDTFRRLNRTEYRNSIRDLLAVDVDVTNLLPADDASHGFDNVTVGDLSPALLERYLSAAQKISRLAIGIPGKQPGGDTFQLPPDVTQEEHFDGLPLGTRGGLAVPYTFPQDAEYEIQVRLARDRNENVEGLSEAHDVELLLDGERIGRYTVKPPPKGEDHHLVDEKLKLRLPLKAGKHTVAAAFVKKPSILLETERQPYQVHFNMDRHPRIQPAVYSINIMGPYSVKGPGDTPSRRRLLVCAPAKPAEEDPCAKRILTTLIQRAYRRPATDADLKGPLHFYKEARTGANFDTGIEMAVRAVLISPEFLFRVEQDHAKTGVYAVSDLELASRLSFFLWSSIPDDELLKTAIAGKLKNPAVLEQQTRRLLADPRSTTLVNNFAAQWLYLRNLATTSPDMRIFPDFDDNLRQSLRQETELFVESIMREDRNVLDLLRANYTFLNERLAKHYGVPHVYGSRFRKVTFPANSERGGLLGQGSILTVSSYATRTSPVIRGKWILSNILGVPPPAPPPNVPALKEKASTGKQSVRERLAEHRSNPACSGCHQLMDPVGFSLENYDAVGRWRTAEDAVPIDSSGGLPDGSKFSGANGLRQALLARPDGFFTTLTEKLMIYGLGRGIESYDAPAVRKVVQQASSKDYRFSSFIVGIVQSQPFQFRRSQ